MDAVFEDIGSGYLTGERAQRVYPHAFGSPVDAARDDGEGQSHSVVRSR